jgi:homoserine kinase
VPTYLDVPVHVRVPATSANLGPGFDSAGMALDLHDDVVVRVAGSGVGLQVSGEGAQDVGRGERHLVVKALRAAFEQLGGQPRGLQVACTNRIPHTRGLGSSSAAIVSGIVAACALVLDADLDDQARLELADALEGHPDNVAACLRGGVTFAWTEPSGPRVLRLDAHPDLAPVAFVPATRSSTKAARGLLPPTVPYADAVLNASRAALLPHALAVDPSLLLPATEDRLHQHYRAQAMPATAALVAELREAGVAAVVSGAGPTVLALSTRSGRAALTSQRPGWRVLPLDAEPRGAHVVAG